MEGERGGSRGLEIWELGFVVLVSCCDWGNLCRGLVLVS